MKKLASYIIAILIILQPISSLAVEIPGYEGGINNENSYKEVVFLTGEPVELEGTLKISIKEKKDIKTEQYTYKLENKQLGAKLSRTVRLSTTFEQNGTQITSKKSLDSYKESLQIGKTKFDVDTDDYQWNQGQVVQNTGLLEFYAGDWSARKTYKVNKGAEEITVQTIGNLIGYDSPWSATETQTLQHIINYENKLVANMEWEGTALVETSYNKTKDYNYVENIPNQISFKGGYILTEKHENTLKYDYDLPVFIKEGTTSWRNIDKGSTAVDTNPIITRLNVPALRDVRGLTAEKDILLIASMNGLPLNSTTLGPATPMSRGDFAKALVGTMDIELPEEETSKKSSRKKVETHPIFLDVPKDHRNFKYIEAVSKNDIMQGVGKDKFDPDRALTKAEATTILIRLLGTQNQAPIKNYTTGFKDDASIPTWAKDHLYMAMQLDIVEKDEYFYPNQAITKEETAVILVNFINYLQTSLMYDFRENILNN